MTSALSALQSIDFDWTTHIDSIWRDLPYDVPGLQETLRKDALTMVERLFASSSRASPLGVVLAGPGGSGKTHLLSLLRQSVVQRGAFFVLVDMTDVREFWDITLLGYIRSLMQGEPSQLERLIRALAEHAGGATTFEKLRSGRPPKLINLCNALINGLREKHPELQEHQDVLRALVLLGSDDLEIRDLGWKWLQSIGIEGEEKLLHGFQKNTGTPRDIVRGLSFLMSSVGPTLLALDQLDAIVAELQLVSHTAGDDVAAAKMVPRHAGALAIIQGIAKGLIALRDTTSRTQTLVACLEQTWHVLDKRALVTMGDRFFPPLPLKPVTDPDHVRQLVEHRIAPAYREHGFVPPYATYPFQPEFFATLRGLSPREVLKRCDEHRWSCLRQGEVFELGAPPGPGSRTSGSPPPGPDFSEIRAEYELLRKHAEVEQLLANEDEDALDKLLEAACRALVAEKPVPEDIEVHTDLDFVGAGAYAPLHARLRLVYRSESDREKHYATRFLQKSNHIAFQARLKAAMTASGIDHNLGFRRLVLFRRGPTPGGAASKRLLEELRVRGGSVVEPSLDELRSLWALAQLFAAGPRAGLVQDWLRAEPIVSTLPSFSDAARYLFSDATKRSRKPPRPETTPMDVMSAPARRGAISLQPEFSPDMFEDQLFVGTKLVAGAPREPLNLPLSNLAKHSVILAGAGSGKTVLVRRMVEEAALLGVPSIVVDGANDLSRLGDAWPELPASFSDRDRTKAERYIRDADVVVWTPGRESGNPLVLDPRTQLDVAKLLTSRAAGKVRVSVINLSGLPDLAAQQRFMNQLATTLFVWIEEHPARDRALQSLLVVDEARDFIPSAKSVPGKDGLLRLTAQGRKYGLGIVFATQAPKSIDRDAITNCSTQFFGRANSPAAIETVQAQLQERGGSGGDIAKLEKGQFYAFTEGMRTPVKIATSLCLSHHPDTPPEESEIVARAAASRARV